MKHNGPNEPAFPRPCGRASDEEANLEQDGMTMREWYATKALQGILSNSDLPDLFAKGFAPHKAAEIAFMCADAMCDVAKRTHPLEP